MELDEIPRLIYHIRDGLVPSLQPLIDMTKALPKTREVKSLQRKLRRSYTSLSDAIDIMPEVARSLESYQPNVSFDAEEAEPNAAQLAFVQRALTERRQRNLQRGQMSAENALARAIRQGERNQRNAERMAAAARGEAVLHFDGGSRRRRRTKKRR